MGGVPPMPPSTGPPAPAGSPPLIQGPPWHVPILPFLQDQEYDSDSDEDEELSEALSLTSGDEEMSPFSDHDLDPEHTYDTNPIGFMHRVLRVDGPGPLEFSPLILRDHHETGDFWSNYPHPVFNPAVRGEWEDYLQTAGEERVAMRRFWAARREFAMDVLPSEIWQELLWVLKMLDLISLFLSDLLSHSCHVECEYIDPPRNILRITKSGDG